jgi:anti-anti-sigma factor
MQSAAVNLSVEARDKATVVTFAAHKLGHEGLESWGERLSELADFFPGRVIILDMSSVMSLSSVAIGKLFKARKKSMATQGVMKIVATSSTVLEVFRTCQVDRIFGIYASVDDAMASIP